MVAQGDLVYVVGPDNKDGVVFVAGTVASVAGEKAAVQLGKSKEAIEVPVAEIRPRFARDDGATSQDNTSLVHLNDATILENLAARHLRDEIYTYTASVLLAVNPYKQIPGLYGDSQCARYRGKHIGALPPHPYAIADTAYRALMRERRNQGLLISGESGAGKTETAKIVMNYLAYASGAASDTASRIQQRVLQAQPILESLGNSVTMRNSNSSRFGKYNRVFFDETGTLVNAGITTYLLESSRVVVHGDRERSYHCFYEMLAGLEEDKLQSWSLDRKGDYRLISTRGVCGFEDKDAANFKKTTSALKTIGFEDEDIEAMSQLLAGLLHLGNVPKEDETPSNAAPDDEARCVDRNEDSIEAAAAVLGMDADELCTALIKKKVAVPGRDSFHMVPRTESQFRQALHSLIKALYNRLFERTVKRINDSFSELSCSPKEGENELNHIGILDIYGFERLQRNSFEQLCINLANERLQQYFIENVLGAEQALYTREGLPWRDLALPDSKPVVNCISQVFTILDEFSQQLAKGFDAATDERFCQKTVQQATQDPQWREVLKQLKMTNKRNSTASLTMNDGFIIKHYAGPVEYTTRGWLDKNNDRLLSECEHLIRESTVPFVRSFADRDQGKTNFRSISKKYSQDLEGLLTTLGTCNLHYIRCFKPNEEQKAGTFKQSLVLDQIVQCGTIELVQIMHDGYPNRCPFDEIAERFRSLLPENFQRYGTRTFIEALMLAYEVPREEWALGMSRLFLKAGQLKALEDMRAEGVRPDPVKLKAIVSSIIRKKWIRAGHAVRLCNFMPKYIASLKAKRAKEALSRAVLVAAPLARRLEAARRLIGERRLAARRRIAGSFHAVHLLCRQWGGIRSKRRERLAHALFLFAWIQRHARPWVQGARLRARDAAQRKEAERRREEERRRLEEARRVEEARKLAEEREAEEERQRQERQRIQEEREWLEEQRLMEEARREEEQRVARERGAEEEERLRQAKEQFEKERTEEREKFNEERRRFEEERQEQLRQFEEERKALQQERKTATEKRLSVVASPLRRTSIHEEMGSPGEETEAGRLSETQVALARAEIQREMDERMDALAKEYDRKQTEVLQQMASLQQRNEVLERQIKEENSSVECRSRSPDLDRGQASPLPLDGSQRGSSASPLPLDSTPESAQPSRASLATSPNSSGAAGGRSKRLSIAQEALSSMGLPGSSSEGRAAGTASVVDVRSQRAWWAQQRQFLMQDLYSHGTPWMSPRGTRGSVGGGPVRAQPALPAPAEAGEAEAANRTTRNLTQEFAQGTASSGGEASGSTKLRQPAQYSWRSRQSMGGHH